ncbi:MAG: alpha-amylase [Anaerolineaceae bacterium]|nr:alpha-amylase [Anaerolineaceae bacterium]
MAVFLNYAQERRVTVWPEKPIIYEINTWVWLDSLSRGYNWPVTLENLPDHVLDEIVDTGCNVVWLMGIWWRSPAARASANKYVSEYRSALPDLTHDDVIGSPYAIGAYQVDENLGGAHGLAKFRQRLRERGILLILDFVPNHVATDHAWVRVHPEFLVLGSPSDLKKAPGNYFSARSATGQLIVVAHGRDPYFPGWIDTTQLNAFHKGLRAMVTNTLLDIAAQCDGVRCDMAMLMLNEVFKRTWGDHVASAPDTEFWTDIIPAVQAQYPDFHFIAEVYWGMEARLQGLGFNYTYDKHLYDLIMDSNVGEIRAHLHASLDYQRHSIRFIENHDEGRAAETLGLERSRPAATLICTLPGAMLLHQGQFEGRRVKLPVQIGRQPYEPVQDELKAFYDHLLAETCHPIYSSGEWRLFEITPGQENDTYKHLIAYGWRSNEDYRLIVVNLTGAPSQGHIRLEGWPDIPQHDWHLNDVLNGDRYLRQGELLDGIGLYVDLAPYQSHILHFERA